MSKEMWFCRNVDKPSLPETLRDTVATRKRVQAEAEALVEGHPDKIPKDARQKALKILSNSHYGAVSVREGINPCRRAGICTPLIGGWMLKTITNAAEAYWPVDVVYGDTDSIMFKFKLEGEVEHCDRPEDFFKVLTYGFALGDRIAKAITGLFPRPVKLEVEKAYSPYAIGSGKKRYAGRLFTLGWFQKPEEKRWEPPVEIKGLENKRRDNCEYFLDLADTLFDCVMKRNDPEAAVEAVRQLCEDTLEGRVPVSKLAISQSLGKTEYKNPPAHVMVAMRRAAEDPGAAVVPGERVFYVICEAGGDVSSCKGKDILGNRCFMPDEVEARELKPDLLYYMENKLIVPISKMIDMLCLGEEPVRMLKDTIKKLKQRRDKVATLDSFFAKVKVDKSSAVKDMEVDTPAVKKLSPCSGKSVDDDHGGAIDSGAMDVDTKAKPPPPPQKMPIPAKRSKTLASFFKRG
jgi:DNA polymerase elongation subunit (family B)